MRQPAQWMVGRAPPGRRRELGRPAPLILVALLTFGCAEAPSAASPASPRPAPTALVLSPPEFSELESQIVSLVNIHRTSAGLPLLEPDDTLAHIARAHSRAMASGRARYGHGGFQRRARHAWRLQPTTVRVGENVAANTMALEHAAIHTVDAWIESPPHRANIDGPFERIGVGVAADHNGILYYTQLFAARAPSHRREAER